ncbi:MAG: hypothetical protein ACI4A7_07170 [Prevotella sp.]
MEMENEGFYLEKFIEWLPDDISGELVSELRESACIKTYDKNAMLPLNDKRRPLAYYIMNGSCVRFIIDKNCEERAVMFHTESFLPMVGNIYEENDNAIIDFRIRANEKTIVLAMERTLGWEWIAKDPAFSTFVLSNAMEYLSTINLFHNHLLGLSSIDMYKWLNDKYPLLFQRFRGKDIANFMGVTPVWLCNIKRRVFKEG